MAGGARGVREASGGAWSMCRDGGRGWRRAAGRHAATVAAQACVKPGSERQRDGSSLGSSDVLGGAGVRKIRDCEQDRVLAGGRA